MPLLVLQDAWQLLQPENLLLLVNPVVDVLESVEGHLHRLWVRVLAEVDSLGLLVQGIGYASLLRHRFFLLRGLRGKLRLGLVLYFLR